MKNARQEQFLSFQLCTVLSSVMKSRTARDVTHPFARRLSVVDAPPPQSLSSHLGYRISCRSIVVLVLQPPLFSFIMTLESTSSDAGDSEVSQRSRKALVMYVRRTTAAWHHVTVPTSLTALRPFTQTFFIILLYHKKGEYSTVRYFGKGRLHLLNFCSSMLL